MLNNLKQTKKLTVYFIYNKYTGRPLEQVKPKEPEGNVLTKKQHIGQLDIFEDFILIFVTVETC